MANRKINDHDESRGKPILTKWGKPDFFAAILKKLIINLAIITSNTSCSKGGPRVIYAHDTIGHNINTYGIYELDILNDIFEFIAKYANEKLTGIAIDAGANIGNHSLYMSKYFKLVYAFEPIPDSYEILKLNIKQKANIIPINKALSSDSDDKLMAVQPRNMGASMILKDPDASTSLAFTKCTTIDAFCSNKFRVNLLKIDVEGHEDDVLNGAWNIISDCTPIILIEQNKEHFLKGSSRAIETLRALGYKFYVRSLPSSAEKSKLRRFLGLIWQALLPYKIAIKEVRPGNIKHASYDIIICLHGSILEMHLPAA